MANFEMTQFIDRPPQEVFDYLTNPDNDLFWQKGLISSEWISPDPAGVGSTKRVVTRFLVKKMDVTVEYTAWDPPNRYAFKSVDGAISVAGTINLEPKENGTQFNLEAQIEGRGLFKLVEGLVARQAKKQDASNFNTLKELLEAG
jgi:carbon monoxide dehydrogenase subunit G